MTSFHYPLPPPESEPTSSLSGLSEEAKAALTGLAMGPSPADKLLGSDGGIIDTLSREAIVWLYTELLTDGALESWRRYKDILRVPAPKDISALEVSNPNLSTTLTRLHEAKQALLASSENTPEGLNVGETMHLVLVPWQEIRNHLADFDRWVKALRDAQGVATRNDYINKELLNAIKTNQPLYRDTDNPSQLLTPTMYLGKKIAKDGPWGIMLMQTSQEAGIECVKGQSPDDMTDNGLQHLVLAGHSVDVMGVFEWIALTMQKDPKELSTQDVSWLLANRITVNGVPQVPLGDWRLGQVKSLLRLANDPGGHLRIRLAVTG